MPSLSIKMMALFIVYINAKFKEKLNFIHLTQPDDLNLKYEVVNTGIKFLIIQNII
jgi:hypothetical protein